MNCETTLEIVSDSMRIVESYLSHHLGLNLLEIKNSKKLSKKNNLCCFRLVSKHPIVDLDGVMPLIGCKVPFNLIFQDGSGISHRLKADGISLICEFTNNSNVENQTLKEMFEDSQNPNIVLLKIKKMQELSLCLNRQTLLAQRNLFNRYRVPYSIINLGDKIEFKSVS